MHDVISRSIGLKVESHFSGHTSEARKKISLLTIPVNSISLKYVTQRLNEPRPWKAESVKSCVEVSIQGIFQVFDICRNFITLLTGSGISPGIKPRNCWIYNKKICMGWNLKIYLRSFNYTVDTIFLFMLRNWNAINVAKIYLIRHRVWIGFSVCYFFQVYSTIELVSLAGLDKKHLGFA